MQQDVAMRAVELTPEQHWSCPNCNETGVTHEARPHTRFHSCKGLRGMTAPFVPAGIKCKVEAFEREDYVGKELVQTDANGRPVMSVVTTRDEGQDCVVFAPTAAPDEELSKEVKDALRLRLSRYTTPGHR